MVYHVVNPGEGGDGEKAVHWFLGWFEPVLDIKIDMSVGKLIKALDKHQEGSDGEFGNVVPLDDVGLDVVEHGRSAEEKRNTPEQENQVERVIPDIRMLVVDTCFQIGDSDGVQQQEIAPEEQMAVDGPERLGPLFVAVDVEETEGQEHLDEHQHKLQDEEEVVLWRPEHGPNVPNWVPVMVHGFDEPDVEVSFGNGGGLQVHRVVRMRVCIAIGHERRVFAHLCVLGL